MKYLLLSLIIFWEYEFTISAQPTVETLNGKISGETLLDLDRKPFYSFQGIPYAKPPLGNLRFKAPQKAEPWNGILNATKAPPVCPQFYFDELIGQEDCLYLNVYTKSIQKNSKRPVMVYIHGGAYSVGSGNSLYYGPEYFMIEDVVLVTLDYRLGYLGALSFKDQTQGVPGNAHLKDQVMALRWIKENIENFGGDKDLVTVFGESVGGASVHMLMLSPMSKGLIHRVIAQSGCALNSWNRGNLGTGDTIADLFGFSSASTSEKIKKLQKIPMEEFVRTTQKPGELAVRVDVPVEFSPVVEKQINEPAYLPKPIIQLFSEASNNVPVLMGYNSNDTIIFQVSRRLYTGRPFIFNDLNETIPSDLALTRDERLELIESMKETFFDSKDASLTTNIGAISEFGLGPWFVAGYVQSLKKHLENNHDVYFYIFSSDTILNFFKRSHPVTAMYKGACHMDELGYLFRTPNVPCFKRDSLEEKSIRQTLSVWTQFAKSGKPVCKTSCKNSWELKKVTDLQNIVYLNINKDKISEKMEPHKRVWDFWRKVYSTFNRVSD